MSRIHFLNVREGDCSLIEHNTGRVSVIDVCNAEPLAVDQRSAFSRAYDMSLRVRGNFRQKEHPVNPIDYMNRHSINSIHRFILTHPDMDHMDGLKALLDEYSLANFWDTNNNKEIKDTSWASSQYDKEDWELYKTIRDGKPDNDPKRLTLYSGASGIYWNQDPPNNGDGIQILAPTPKLVEEANKTEDYNDCSYVILYKAEDRKVIFGGDSHDKTWDHILENHEAAVSDIDLLIAPHHGRDSGRSYEFLDVLNPKVTFFGNARSQDLAYHAWNNRGLYHITNNQANCMIVDITVLAMNLYVTYETFARAENPDTFYNDDAQGWFVKAI